MRRFAQQSFGRYRRPAAAVLTVLATFPAGPGAWAADWSANALFNETIEYNDNYGLDIVSPGDTVGALSSVVFDLGAATPTLRMGFVADLEYDRYWGEGRPVLDRRFLRSFSGDLVKDTPQTTYELQASRSITPSGANELTGTGSGTSVTEQITTTASSSILHEINRSNSLSWNNSARKTDYSPAGSGDVPSLDLESSLAWLHKISRRTDGDATFSVEYFAPEDLANTESFIYRPEVGITTQLTRKLTLTAGGGAAVLESSFDDPLVPGGRDHTLIVDWIGDAQLTLALKRTIFTLGASRDLSPSNEGDIQLRKNINLAVTHAINDHSSLALTAYASQSVSGGTTDEAISVSPSYSYRLSRYWDAQLSYRYLRTDGNTTDPAEGNAFFFSLSRDVVILP